ncbi:hypothetical protein K2173_017154 [Erythroxylum novogranatense]|uniref:TIR domain-containing protein n=1 Tax=Erythroxylum novogranatense TaxID=1862640 RepID=A0AAV8UA58_9ROSI|nr:hypothetical protein K2173_017154 [Erythroxylum novogranatense]
MLPILAALALALFALAIITLHFYKTQPNNRVSSSPTPAETDGTGSVLSASPNPEQSPGGGRDCPKGQEQGSFHVFLSFRGPDVRSGFLGHLYDAFVREGIRTYIDDEELRKGEEIDGSLMKAIEDSRIAVVLLSKNYASSRWCLDELAKIMELRKEEKIVVKPVFYRVDPREVRTPRESFAKALAAHEAKLGKDSDKVKRWREGLFEVGSLSGWHLDDKGHEAELVRSIVKDVNVLLDRPRLDVAKYPVGIEARVEQIKNLLSLGSGKVLLVGLWGMGGVGKTTIAKAVFNAIADQYEGCAFLQNVREESTNPSVGLTKLQEKLLSEVLRRKDVKVSSTAAGISLIEDRLSSKKVLLLLDDVSESEQLDALAGGLHWFGSGSRILITTRDSALLTVCNEYVVHKVEELPYEEALQLFSRHSSLESNRPSIPMDLVNRCLDYTKGLPLALAVLGSLLRNRPEIHWKGTLKKLADSPAKDIDKVLRVSFDGLERNEREIFLDIACFFKGLGQDYIENVIDACSFEASTGIQILIERCLITIDGYTIKGAKQVQMHDLLQLTGKNIVCEEFPDEPESRSRLWDYEHVLDVLSNGAGSNAIKAIVVRLGDPTRIRVDADVLTKFRKLRLLVMHKVTYNGDPLSFPSGLCWLEWLGYSASTFVFSPDTAFKHMRHISLERCQRVTEIPDLSSCRNLETLNFSNCTGLVRVDNSVGYLEKLIRLSLGGCGNLAKFPDELHWRSLETLTLAGCYKLEKFPEVMVEMERLEKLGLRRTGIRELPASVVNLVSVKSIDLSSCSNLMTVPCSIYRLRNLVSLDLRGCWSLEVFPQHNEGSTEPAGSVGFPSLLCLKLSRCNLRDVEFLGGVNCFPKLTELYLSENDMITEIPSLSSFENLEKLYIDKCRRLRDIAGLPVHLRVLIANGCGSVRRIQGLSPSCIADFDEINLSSCPELANQGIHMAGVLPLEVIFSPFFLSFCSFFRCEESSSDLHCPQEARKLRPDANFAFTGTKLPDWLQQSNFPDSVLFLVPSDMADNLVGIISCGVFDLQEGVGDGQFICFIEMFIDDESVHSYGDNSFSLEHASGVVLLRGLDRYNSRSVSRLDELLRKHDREHFMVSLVFTTTEGGFVRKCGFRLIFKGEENESRDVQLLERLDLLPDEGHRRPDSQEVDEQEEENS